MILTFFKKIDFVILVFGLSIFNVSWTTAVQAQAQNLNYSDKLNSKKIKTDPNLALDLHLILSRKLVPKIKPTIIQNAESTQNLEILKTQIIPLYNQPLIAKSFSGQASWYGPGFHGRLTASGEIYNQNALTAAHRYLGFGTRVRVTNLNNGRSVIVRINDRGPYAKGRVIDVSAAAARTLGMIHSGVAPVRITILGR